MTSLLQIYYWLYPWKNYKN